ncbi:endonuclease/exonuclease/phosphatase family protein [Simiduia agarivorans]|uniref:Endonuclease/exonuclease/phosphatase domain-containing protein n=1 Tax=Simiduia agarivorans (strain DSM 21679 / JCM 13881 / BCRC 17597 / SA1) TaxID=1117647 RepID=K4KHZ4_SIMAS|nr:endonuclease/exonuclease/phosphatase family protein [Simiduia agarivorans]AFU97810.1 hypothetical protein M5M_02995 [Simiduia agarivorans SA1 = DSM 21679]
MSRAFLRRVLLGWLLVVQGVWADVITPSDRVTTGLNVRALASDTVIAALAPGESATYVATIPQYYVIELADGRRGRVAKAWARYVEGTTQSILKIASFNIQIFGMTKAGKPAVMAELADIVRQYDVVAVQEIKDASQQVPTLFLNTINADGTHYAFLLSERGGQQPDDQGSQEPYAFFYNTDTVKPVDAGQLFDDAADDLFQREPFMARFASVQGGLTFVMITVHTKPEEAVPEIKALHRVVQTAQAHYLGEDDFVVLGDFNAGCDYASPAEFVGHAIASEYHWLIPDDADTNVSTNSACAYDRILITEGMVGDYTGEWGVGTVSSKTVSDHFPVWAEFKVGHHN